MISYITVNYNQTALTLDLLASIEQHHPTKELPFEIIVVDNNSKQSPRIDIETRYPEVLVLESDKNLGFAGGNNLAIKASRGAWLFFINNDALLTPGAVKKMLEVFTEFPNAGAVSPLICYHFSENSEHKKNTDLIQYAGATAVNQLTGRNVILGEQEPDNGQYQKIRKTPYVHGAAMMVTREVIQKAGMMDDAYFLYYEELDWSERIRQAGFDIYVQPHAKIYHRESVTTGNNSPLKTYYLNRNRILFMKKHHTALRFLLFSIYFWFIAIPKNSLSLLLTRQWDALQAFWKAIFWNYFPNSERKLIVKNQAKNPEKQICCS